MLIRLANVIYWTCTVIAVLWAAVAIYATFYADAPRVGHGCGHRSSNIDAHVAVRTRLPIHRNRKIRCPKARRARSAPLMSSAMPSRS